MKNAIILHGIGSNPNEFWFPYIKKGLEKKGYQVSIPQLPDKDNPNIKTYLPWILKKEVFNKETVLIGHSSGASLILAILESLNTKIKQAILVSGFLIRGGVRPRDIVKKENEYNWKKIKSNVENIVIINSTNDPWGCNDKQGKKIFKYLGGVLIINNNGHMGSNTYKQPYKEFPLLLQLIN